eukprot:scaffold98640_cov33-Tisochrysis_lutea.AAC.4
MDVRMQRTRRHKLSSSAGPIVPRATIAERCPREVALLQHIRQLLVKATKDVRSNNLGGKRERGLHVRGARLHHPLTGARHRAHPPAKGVGRTEWARRTRGARAVSHAVRARGTLTCACPSPRRPSWLTP